VTKQRKDPGFVDNKDINLDRTKGLKGQQKNLPPNEDDHYSQGRSPSKKSLNRTNISMRSNVSVKSNATTVNQERLQ